MPSSKHTLNSYITAAGISFGAVFSPQVTHAQQIVQSRVESLTYCHQEIDIHTIAEPYTIQAGDTFSRIAAERNIPYGDFELVWSFVNPGKNINDTIRVGDQFYIMKAGDDVRQLLEQYKVQIEARNNLDVANILFHSGDISALDQQFAFDITPILPINLGMKRANDVLLNMIALGHRIGPRNALPALEDTAACLHVIKQYLKYTMGFDTSVPVAFFDALRLEGQSAWIFPQKLEEIGYTREYDLREYFSQSFPSTRVAIRYENQEMYREGLKQQLEYLSTDTALSAFIPTLYQGTGYASEVFRGSERNSHMFFNLGVGETNVFSASAVKYIDQVSLEEGMPLDDFLVYLVKDYGQISRYQTLSQDSILSALSLLGEHVQIKIDGTFLQGQEISGISQRIIYPHTQIQVLGPMLMDGFQITPSGNRNYIEARFVPAWIVYLGAFLPGNTGIFFPTSIVSAPEQLISSLPEGATGNLSNQIPIYQFFDLKEGEDARFEYMNLIALQRYQKNITLLSPYEISQVEDDYSLHSLGLQLLGYHAFGGTDWNPGSTNINAPIPFLYLPDAQSRANLQSLYQQYIDLRKQDFYEQISFSCDIGVTVYPDFIQVVVFPGDSKEDILNLIEHYLAARGSEYFSAFQDFDALQKDFFLGEILGDNIVNGVFGAGDSYFISFAGVEQQIQAIADISYLHGLPQLSERDRTLFQLFSENTFLQQIIGFSAVNEGYVNRSYFSETGIDALLGLNNLHARGGRKGQKEVYRYLSDNNLLPILAEYIDVPTTGPRSFGDFQLRIENLYDPETAFKLWPTKDDIYEALELVLNPESRFMPLIQTTELSFSHEVSRDRALAEAIYEEIQHEAPDGVKVAELLKELFQTNDVRNIHIIGKIISLSLLGEKLDEHSTHLVELLRRSEMQVDITDPIQRERFAKSILLINNIGENNTFAVFFENYLRRIFRFYQKRFPERAILLPPESRRSEGLGGAKAFYTRDFLREDILFYAQELSNIPELSSLRDDFELLLGDKISNETLYKFISESEIQEIFQNIGLDAHLFPTQSEFYARDIFGYTNERNLTYRVVEPERKFSDFRGFFLATVLGGYILSSTLGGVGSIVQRYVLSPTGRATSIVQRYVLSPTGRATSIVGASLVGVWKKRRKKRKDKKFSFTLEKAYRESGLQSYLETRKNQEGLVLDSQSTDYMDGIYTITPEDGIVVRKVFTDSIVLSNEEGHPLAGQYKDGRYEIIEPITRIIREHTLRILEERRKNVLYLRPENRIERNYGYAIAAAE